MERVRLYYPYIDGLKGIAILLMVMAHALAWSYPDSAFLSHKFCDMTVLEFNSSFVWKVIYSFHMPLLFAVSGFLFYKPLNYDWKNSMSLLNKRIIRILVPYIVTGGFIYFLKGYFGYWFLQILFIVNVIVVLEYLLLNYLKASIGMELFVHILTYLSLFVVCRILSHYQMPRELNNLPNLNSYYISFMLGILIREFSRLEEFLTKPSVSFACFILYIVVFTLCNTKFNIPYIDVMLPLFAIVFLYGVCKKCNFENGGGKYISLIGKNSLEIYILHLFFVMPFSEIGYYIIRQANFPMSITLQITYSLSISAIAIFLSIVFAGLLKKNKILSKLIFGM